MHISLILIAASGIFGDLRAEIAPPSERDWLSAASVPAILSPVAVGAITVWLLHPQPWSTGTDVEWLARWSGARTRDLKDAALKELVSGFAENHEITKERGERLTWLLWAVVIQTLCVVLVQIVATVDSAA